MQHCSECRALTDATTKGRVGPTFAPDTASSSAPAQKGDRGRSWDVASAPKERTTFRLGVARASSHSDR